MKKTPLELEATPTHRILGHLYKRHEVLILYTTIATMFSWYIVTAWS